MISAGRLRHTATVLRAASVSSLAEPSNWEAIGSPFAVDYREESSGQSSESGGAVTVVSVEIRARWDTWVDRGVLPTDRLSVDVNGTRHVVRINGVINLQQANRVAVVSVSEVIR